MSGPGRNQPPPEAAIVGGRVPPNDVDSEAAVLSAAMLSRDAFDIVNEILSAEQFYSEANKRVYEAILELHRAMRAVDVISVASWLRDRERLQQIGGTPYLMQLTDATPAVANVETHAKIVREKYRLRRLIGTCQKYSAEGYGDCGDVQTFIDSAEQSIFDIARVTENNSTISLRDAVVQAFKILSEATAHGGGITGIPTGFVQLDRMTSGMHPGDLYIVAGRPGMGKTSFVLNLALNVARPRPAARLAADDPYGEDPGEKPGYGVAFFSLEMPKEQLAARILASEARVSMSDIRKGNVQGSDWSKLTESAARLGTMPVWLDDTPALGLLDLRAKVRRLQAEISRGPVEGRGKIEKMGLVAVDYLQLMKGRSDAGSREQEISELSRGLKQLAKELSVPVIALSQLNRSVETRNTKDKRPQLSDLRESGAIEQDADAIMFIYRDEYYNEDSEEKGIAEIILSKQRNGPTGTVKTRFTGAYTRFDNLENDDYYDQMDDLDAAIDQPQA